jgi:hypothetical protein
LLNTSSVPNMIGNYVDAYRRYCWPVHSPLDLKLAPLHLLATEGSSIQIKDHVWHMETLARLCHPRDGERLVQNVLGTTRFK